MIGARRNPVDHAAITQLYLPPQTRTNGFLWLLEDHLSFECTLLTSVVEKSAAQDGNFNVAARTGRNGTNAQHGHRFLGLTPHGHKIYDRM
jgi:hypothetical protein